MEKTIIITMMYIELNDELGPNPVFCFPTDFSLEEQMRISIKTITLLSGEDGLVPESLVILPFPSLNLKGLIKYITWNDINRRGGIGQSAIVMLFQDVDDVIFYKYKTNFELIFAEKASQIILLEKSKEEISQIESILENLEQSIKTILNDLRLKEISIEESKAFPETGRGYDSIDYKFKIIICGDPGVGKTSLILRFTQKVFKRNYIPTLGVVVSDRTFNIDGTVVQLVIWDIAGQVKFDTMRQQFYLGTDGVVLVFDLTNSKSFESIPKWYQDIRNKLHKTREIIGFVVGNKTDLVHDKIVISKEASNLANNFNLEYIETSALTGVNVEDAFYNVAKLLLKSFEDDS
jgi:small GTP-binding protein